MAARVDREAKLAALHARLADEISALRTSEQWTAWLKVASRFHDYSFNNTLLILAQRPDATTVAGYRAWQALGRQVNKGEKGLQILAPILKRTTDPDTPDDPPRAKVVGYRVTHVWDVSQTTGKPLPEKSKPQLLEGSAPDGLWDRLTLLVQERGFAVERGDCRDANGLTNFAERTVRVRTDVDEAQAVKTLAHELGHVLLHEPSDGAAVVACRGVAEVEAESVAYLVATSHDLDVGAYAFPYVLSWAGSVEATAPEDVVRQVGQRVLRAAGIVLDHTGGRTSQLDGEALAEAAQRAQLAAARAEVLRDFADQLVGRTENNSVDMQLLAIHGEATHFFTRHLNDSWVPDYLVTRGLAPVLDGVGEWQVGYAPDSWTALTDHLRAAGYTDSSIEASGLALRARNGNLVDRFRDRLMLPIRDADGEARAFVGRARPGAPDRVPKYLNSPTSRIYRKGDQLLGAAEGRAALAHGATPVLVEGPLDALAVSVASPARHAPLALCGTALTDRQADLLRRLSPAVEPPVVVATDGDDPGREAACAAYEKLRRVGMQPWSADLPPGLDPCDVLQVHGPRPVAAGLAEHAFPLVDVVVDARIVEWSDRLRWIEGQVGCVRDAARFIAGLPPEQVGRQVQRLADTTGLSPETIRNEIDGTALRLAAQHRLSARGSRVSLRQLADSTGPASTATGTFMSIHRPAAVQSSAGIARRTVTR
jgi:DNA primase